MAEMYKNIKTGVKAELVEINEKTKQVTLKKEDGKFTASNKSAFEQYWKKIEDDKTADKAEKKKVETTKPVEEKKVDPEKKEEPKVEKQEKTAKPKKEKKAPKSKKEALPVQDDIIKELDASKMPYKVVGRYIKLIDQDNKVFAYVQPNKVAAKLYIKETFANFSVIADIAGNNGNKKSKYTKIATIEYSQIPTLFRNLVTIKK